MRYKKSQPESKFGGGNALSKSINTLSSLSRDDLVRSIRQQGKSNGMGTWEIDALIETFDRRNSLRKAYHILLEYSGLEKDIYKLIGKRKGYMEKLLENLTTGGTENEFELPHIVSKLAEYSLKSWVSICRWRQLQWSPRPITIASRFSPTKSHFLFEFQRDIGLLLGKARESKISMVDKGVDPMHLVIVLVTAAAEAVDDISIVEELLKSEGEPSSQEPSSEVNGSRNRHAQLMPYEDLIGVLQEISREEVTAESTWQAFLALKGGHVQPDVFPVLRLSYGSIMPPAIASSDFPAAYRKGCGVLLGFFYSHFAEDSNRDRSRESDRHEVILQDLINFSGAKTTSSVMTTTEGSSDMMMMDGSSIVMDTAVEDGIRHKRESRPYSSPARQRPLVLQTDRPRESSRSPEHDRLEGNNHRGSSSQEEVPRWNPSERWPLDPPRPSSLDSSSMVHTGEGEGKHRQDDDDDDDAIDPNSELFKPVSVSKSPHNATKTKTKRLRASSAGTYFSGRGGRGSEGQLVDVFLRLGGDTSCSDTTSMLLDVQLETRSLSNGGGSVNKLIIAGYSSVCNSSTKKNVFLGDELVELGGYDVKGLFPVDIAGILVSYQRGEVVTMKAAHSHHSAFTSSSSSEKRSSSRSPSGRNRTAIEIPARLRRHYDGWDDLNNMFQQYAHVNRDDSRRVISPDDDIYDQQYQDTGNHQKSSSRAKKPLQVDTQHTFVQPSSGELQTASAAKATARVVPTILEEYSRVVARLKVEIEEAENELRAADQDGFLTAKEKVLQKYDELHEMQEAFYEEKLRMQTIEKSDASDQIEASKSSDSAGALEYTEDVRGDSKKEGLPPIEENVSGVRRSLRAKSLIKNASGGNRIRSTSCDSEDTYGSYSLNEEGDEEDEACAGLTPSQMIAKANAEKEVKKKASVTSIRPTRSESPSNSSQPPTPTGRRTPTRGATIASPSSPSTRGKASATFTYPEMPSRISSPSRSGSPTRATRMPGDTRLRVPTRHAAFTPSPQSSSGFCKSRKRTAASRSRAPTDLLAAIRNVDFKNRHRSPRARAALKIMEWWRLLYPQRMLAKRMAVRSMCQDLLYEFLDGALAKAIRTMRQRFNMMRQGAAIKIQRYFRFWIHNVLSRYITIQRFFKRCIARKHIRYLTTVTRAACIIGRYIYKRKIRLRHPVGKKNLYRRVIRGVIETIGLKIRDKKQKEIQAQLNLMALPPRRLATQLSQGKMIRQSRHNSVYVKRLGACITIQTLFRIGLARRRMQQKIREKEQRGQILFTMYCMKLRRKIRHRRELIAKARKLQAVWRGSVLRWKLMLQVLAGIKVNSAWRKYRQYWKLKRCLRRIEIPVNIVLHGIRDIPANLMHTGVVKVRVSVWWTGLLHLVEQDDFMTVILSKQPNIVRTTKLYPCTEMARTENPKPEVTAPEPPPPPKPARKLSMVQTANLLRAKSTSSQPQTAAEKLAEFARLHEEGKLGNVKRKTIANSPSIGILEGDEEDSDSSSDDSESKDSEVGDGGDMPAIARSTSFNSPAIQARMSFDSIGRESVNSLGSNLLVAESPDNSSTTLEGLRPRGNLHLYAKSSRNLSSIPVDPNSTLARMKRNSLTPVAVDRGKEDSGGFAAFSNVKILTSALGVLKAAPKELFYSFSQSDSAASVAPSAEAKFSVNLDDEDLYIPGCHGNSVIRFDFYDGDRKFGTNVYQLASDQSLMFWGGELTRKIEVLNQKRGAVVNAGSAVRANRSRAPVGSTSQSSPVLEVGIKAGAPSRSRCGWCMMLVKGTGPLKRKMRARGFIKSFFDNWDHLYLSLDGEALFLYEARNAVEPLLVLTLSQVKSIHIELMETTPVGSDPNVMKKGAKAMEDKFIVVISTHGRDVLMMKFQEPLIRENWVRTIVSAVDYNATALQNRLRKNISRDHNLFSSSSEDRTGHPVIEPRRRR